MWASSGWYANQSCHWPSYLQRSSLQVALVPAGIVYHKFSVITVPDLARGLGGVASSNSLSDGEPKISPQYSDFKMTGLFVAEKNG